MQGVPAEVQAMLIEQITRVCNGAKDTSTISVKQIMENLQPMLNTDGVSAEMQAGAFTLAMSLVMHAAINSGDEIAIAQLQAILPQPA